MATSKLVQEAGVTPGGCWKVGSRRGCQGRGPTTPKTHVWGSTEGLLSALGPPGAPCL